MFAPSRPTRAVDPRFRMRADPRIVPTGVVLSLAAVVVSGSRVAAWWQRVTCTKLSCHEQAETVEIFARTGSSWTREAAIPTPTVDLYSFGSASGR